MQGREDKFKGTGIGGENMKRNGDTEKGREGRVEGICGEEKKKRIGRGTKKRLRKVSKGWKIGRGMKIK